MADLLSKLRREFPTVQVWAAGGVVLRELHSVPGSKHRDDKHRDDKHRDDKHRDGTGGDPDSGRGRTEVLLVHRPLHGDWSFPKGKLDMGETLGQAAKREVREETGLRCKRIERLPVVRYQDSRGREKAVVYWTMKVLDGQFQANPEVDCLGWFDPLSARQVVTYDRDVVLLDSVTGIAPSYRMLA